MLPFYFLTIMLNAVCGAILGFRGGCSDEKELSFSLDNGTLRLILGGLSLLTGILKILSPVSGNVPVVGDLFPALCNLATGGILVFEWYRGRSDLVSEQQDKLAAFIEPRRKIAGLAALGAAALHFVFSPVLFL
jgi:hypothetical protein